LEPPSCSPVVDIVLLSDLLQPGFLVPSAAILVLLILSALFSGSEVAFFSLTPSQISDLRAEQSDSSRRIIRLLEDPDRERASRLLLATVLIGNNLVNICIVILSGSIMPYLFKTYTGQAIIMGISVEASILNFLIQVVAVTLFLVLFGEVIPKVYATNHNLQLARIMALPIDFMKRLFLPISKPLISSATFLETRFAGSKANISLSDLGHALELTQNDRRSEEEQKILEGIVSFGSKDVKQIMTPRTDIHAFSDDLSFQELLNGIIRAGYSRVPIYSESIDQILGILYIKDLLRYMDCEDMEWKSLLRPQLFVPENKKIDDLLKEFQKRKVHMAVVVDEYGGTLGLVTLEDVIEEIVGDITDEFDDEGLNYSQIDKNNYVFEGKTALIDVYRVLDIDGSPFEAAKGDADTLAGFIIEQAGKIPIKGERISFDSLIFTIEAADKRKIKQVKVTLTPHVDA